MIGMDVIFCVCCRFIYMGMDIVIKFYSWFYVGFIFFLIVFIVIVRYELMGILWILVVWNWKDNLFVIL